MRIKATNPDNGGSDANFRFQSLHLSMAEFVLYRAKLLCRPIMSRVVCVLRPGALHHPMGMAQQTFIRSNLFLEKTFVFEHDERRCSGKKSNHGKRGRAREERRVGYES